MLNKKGIFDTVDLLQSYGWSTAPSDIRIRASAVELLLMCCVKSVEATGLKKLILALVQPCSLLNKTCLMS